MSGKKLIDEATQKDFREDGAVVLRGFFAGWIERLQAGVERNIAEPSTDVRIYDGTNGRHFGDYCNWDRIPEFRDFAFNSPAAAINSSTCRPSAHLRESRSATSAGAAARSSRSACTCRARSAITTPVTRWAAATSSSGSSC